MNKLKTFSLTLALAAILTSCSSPKKTVVNEDQKNVNDSLITIVTNALQEKNHLQAERGIFALILNSTPRTWPYIQSALSSLPKPQALELLNKATQSESIKNSSSNLFNIAKIYIVFKEREKALEYVNTAHQLDKKNTEILYWRARLLSVLKDYEAAENDFISITKSKPKNQLYKEQYASFLQETKQFDKAQKLLHELDPSLQNLYKRIIFALQNDNSDAAETAFNQLKAFEVEEDLKNEKHFYLGESAYWLKNPKISEENFRKVKGGDNYLDARQMLSHMLYEQKRYDEAIELLHQLQNAELNYSTQAYLIESQIYREQEDYDSAIDTLNRSLELIPDNTDILYNRAMIYESQNKMDKAIVDLKKAIEINPEFTEAYNALGYSMADHDMHLDEALEYITIALDRSPENAAILDSMGWVQYKLGNIEQAEKYLIKAHSKNLEDPEIYIHLHKVKAELNKKAEADKILQEAKEKFPENKAFKKYLTELE